MSWNPFIAIACVGLLLILVVWVGLMASFVKRLISYKKANVSYEEWKEGVDRDREVYSSFSDGVCLLIWVLGFMFLVDWVIHANFYL